MFAGLVAAASLVGLTVGSVPSGASGGATSLPTAYVTNAQLTTVSVFAGSESSGTVPKVGSGPTGIAIDAQNKSAYVADYGFLNQPAHTVTPINLTTQTAGKPITVGSGPLAIAIRPGGHFAVVTLQGTAKQPGHQIREINLTTRAVSAPVDVGVNPESLAIAPNGQTAYVADFSSAEVTPVSLTTWPPKAKAPIKLKGTSPRAIAISPGGGRAYVLDAAHATIIPITLPSDKVGTPVDLVCQEEGDPGCTPSALTISPDGRTAYIAAAGSGDVVMLGLPSLASVGVVETGAYPDALGLSGQWLYVANGESNTISAFSGLGSPRTIGDVTYPFGVAVVPGTGSTSQTVGSARASAAGSVRPHGASRATVETHVAPFYGLPRA
jgi:DNA-binding beta-propeller fold protein YncE